MILNAQSVYLHRIVPSTNHRQLLKDKTVKIAYVINQALEFRARASTGRQKCILNMGKCAHLHVERRDLPCHRFRPLPMCAGPGAAKLSYERTRRQLPAFSGAYINGLKTCDKIHLCSEWMQRTGSNKMNLLFEAHFVLRVPLKLTLIQAKHMQQH